MVIGQPWEVGELPGKDVEFGIQLQMPRSLGPIQEGQTKGSIVEQGVEISRRHILRICVGIMASGSDKSGQKGQTGKKPEREEQSSKSASTSSRSSTSCSCSNRSRQIRQLKDQTGSTILKCTARPVLAG